MRAAMDRGRLRGGRPPRPWLDRHWRNDRRFRSSDFPDSGNLLCDRALVRWPRTEGRGALAIKTSMIGNLPKPIALYVSAENSGDTKLFDECFVNDAVVRDENETHRGLVAIKNWKAETKSKYQHTVDPLRIAEQDGKFIVRNRLTGNFP